jgi:hypothetical protein
MTEPHELYAPYIENIQDAGDDHCRGTCPCPRRSKRSFHFHKVTGYYGCWSCNDHGSLYKFLTDHDVEVGRARDVTARIRENVPSDVARLQRKQAAAVTRNDVLPEYALAEYHQCPVSLIKAGFDPLLLERYDVGFDVERSRITFGIRDKEGRLVGISGRTALVDGVPRYMVYDSRPEQPAEPGKWRRPEGPLRKYAPDYVPNNKAHVYGAHTFCGRRSHKRTEGSLPIVITEGYKSTLWLRQLEFHLAVGLQGSMMTKEQEEVLLALGGPFVVLLDNEPGKQSPDPKAMRQRAKLLLSREFREADKIRSCDAVQIAQRLRRRGQSALIGQYPPGSPPGTAPDDLTKDQILYAIENAITPTGVVLNGAHHIRHGGPHGLE